MAFAAAFEEASTRGRLEILQLLEKWSKSLKPGACDRGLAEVGEAIVRATPARIEPSLHREKVETFRPPTNRPNMVVETWESLQKVDRTQQQKDMTRVRFELTPRRNGGLR